jgi:hypothetical protein
MKATKVSRKIEILSTFLCLGTIIALLASCDVFESDPDILEPQVEISGDEVYVLANGTSFIDLQSKVHSTLEARLAVTSSPSHGTLTDLGKGIMQYAPKVGNARVKDGFEVTVFSKSNEILKKDTVVIIVENDSTKLPCSIYPVNDYVYNVASAVTIDVTANDIICSSDVVVSVYRPENTFPPYYGTAIVTGDKIVYTPGATFPGEDKLMYKLTAANDPKLFAYGMVYLTGGSSCQLALRDDAFVYDSLEGNTIKLPVFLNDSICEALNLYQVNIKTNPLFGKASITSDGILYEVTSSAGNIFYDHFTYEVCLDAICETARVDVKHQTDSLLNCRMTAVSDSISIDPTSNVVFLDVLQNDSICTQMKTFEITKAPNYGTAFVNLDKKQIEYSPDPFATTDDWMDYKICDDEWCSTTTVYMTRKK